MNFDYIHSLLLPTLPRGLLLKSPTLFFFFFFNNPPTPFPSIAASMRIIVGPVSSHTFKENDSSSCSAQLPIAPQLGWGLISRSSMPPAFGCYRWLELLDTWIQMLCLHLSSFSFLGPSTWYSKIGFILAYRFRDFSPSSFALLFLGLWWVRIWWRQEQGAENESACPRWFLPPFIPDNSSPALCGGALRHTSRHVSDRSM